MSSVGIESSFQNAISLFLFICYNLVAESFVYFDHSYGAGYSKDTRFTAVTRCPRHLLLARISMSGGQGYEPCTENTDKNRMRTLYPSTDCVESGNLPVEHPHVIHYRVYGNSSGVPALFLHGGPGAGCFPTHARFFDPSFYRIVSAQTPDFRSHHKLPPPTCPLPFPRVLSSIAHPPHAFLPPAAEYDSEAE